MVFSYLKKYFTNVFCSSLSLIVLTFSIRVPIMLFNSLSALTSANSLISTRLKEKNLKSNCKTLGVTRKREKSKTVCTQKLRRFVNKFKKKNFSNKSKIVPLYYSAGIFRYIETIFRGLDLRGF